MTFEQRVAAWLNYASSLSPSCVRRNERIAAALVRRYRDGDVPATFAEIGADLGVNDVAAYQMVRRGLTILRTAPRRRFLAELAGTALGRAIETEYLDEFRCR